MAKNTSNSGYSYLKQESVNVPLIDLVNPYQLQKGVQFELSKMDDMSGDAYVVALDRALKKMSKDPNAYRELQLANYKEVKKEDDKLQMKEVGKKVTSAHKTDSSGHLKKALVKNEKANVSDKKENKKGKPKGVKEMSSKPKKASGVKMMEMPGKEQVLNELRSFLQKKSKLSEDLHYKYTIGQEVRTPEGIGQVTEIVGGTISVKLENDTVRDYQVNILDKQEEAAKNQPEEARSQEESLRLTKEEVTQKIKEYIQRRKRKGKFDEGAFLKTVKGKLLGAFKNMADAIKKGKDFKAATGDSMIAMDSRTDAETKI